MGLYVGFVNNGKGIEIVEVANIFDFAIGFLKNGAIERNGIVSVFEKLSELTISVLSKILGIEEFTLLVLLKEATKRFIVSAMIDPPAIATDGGILNPGWEAKVELFEIAHNRTQ